MASEPKKAKLDDARQPDDDDAEMESDVAVAAMYATDLVAMMIHIMAKTSPASTVEWMLQGCCSAVLRTNGSLR